MQVLTLLYFYSHISVWIICFLFVCFLLDRLLQSIYFRMFCSALFSCISHSIDICTVAIKNIRNMHAVATNQIADILDFNDSYVIAGISYNV